MRRSRKAKIVATLGPATSTKETIRDLFVAGADVFRLNFSHGSHDDHQARYDTIREVEREVERPIGVLADMQGPKLRIGTVKDGSVELEAGQTYRLDLDPQIGDETRAPLPHPEIFAAISPGTALLIDDGKLRLEVAESTPDYAITKVVTGGPLRDRKGVNLPGVILPISPLTDKDRKDLDFALDLGVDWVALSFVQRPEDLTEARRLIGDRATIMTKIEKPAALDCLPQLVALSDAVMVARGDLGVEMPPESIPGRQKQIVHACRLSGVPVVVATQMLESMIAAPAPTRAEASDVATAVYDGADAVMLSAETAAGQYPNEAVAIMDRIIQSTEIDPSYRGIIHARDGETEATGADAISTAAAQVSATISTAAIVNYTMSGSTALRAARQRPNVPILVLTNEIRTARRLAVLWGAHCVHTEDVSNTQEMVDKASRIAVREGFANLGDNLAITAGVPFRTPGTTNMLRIAKIEQ
ncbi:pyruvate kinase [Pelagibius sp.]|uniref:pyruvate kinase n=1 Tax=Pelagibius sp. TaxID=1931238 RepID=UPI0026355178|nr:pyruvate kinase [Pelagibius sp.]